MIIIEGIDGVGKTTATKELLENGFEKYHFDYDKKSNDLFKKYVSVLADDKDFDSVVMDRSFISEITYGPVMRGKSRISDEEFIKLLDIYAKVGCKIIYLTASKDILLERRQEDPEDYEMIDNHYDDLSQIYYETMETVKKHLPVIEINTDRLTKPLDKKNISVLIKK